MKLLEVRRMTSLVHKDVLDNIQESIEDLMSDGFDPQDIIEYFLEAVQESIAMIKEDGK